jgi:ribosomal protein L7/L12
MSDINKNKINIDIKQKFYSDSFIDSVFYNKNDSLIFKKTERIASATHLITRHMVQGEPLRTNLRKKVIGVFLKVVRVLKNPTQQHMEDTYRVFSEFLALLTVAKESSLVSEQNYVVMYQACSGCIDELYTHLEGGKKFDVPESFFETWQQDENHENQKDNKIQTQSYKGQKTEYIKDTKLKTRGSIKDKKDAIVNKQKSVSNSLNKDDRQAIIKNIVSREGEVSIKDISAVIIDCSEKTLQRDINELLEKNVFKKKGRRRWSRYLLA